MSQVGGGAFSLISVDLAELFIGTPPGLQVQIDGVLFGGGSVSTTFSTDGINDGPAGVVADFETFSLPAGFGNLTEVTFTGSNPNSIDQRFQFDNLVVPEPGAGLTFGLGMIGLVVMGRRRCPPVAG